MADLKTLSEIIRNMDGKALELEKAVLGKDKKKVAKLKEEIIGLQKKASVEIEKIKHAK